MTTHNHTIPDRSPPGSTRSAPFPVHQDGGVKYASGASSKIRGRDNITIGTWNTRTLTATGKLQELTHETDRYRWKILGLCEMRWKNFGETTTEEGHKVFFSGKKEDKHEHCVGFLVHEDTVNTVMGCRPVSSRLITIRLRAVPFNITIVHSRQSISFSDRLAKVTDCSSPLFCHGSKTATSPQVLQSAESTVSRSEPYSFSVSGKTRSIFRQQRRLVTFHPGP